MAGADAGGANVIIIGGGGFIGRKLAEALAGAGEVAGRPIASMVQADLAAPENLPPGAQGMALNITDAAAVKTALRGRDVIFHLAAVVSSQAELEFDLGLAVNLMGTLNVLEGARAAGIEAGAPPLLVYASSVAVYGGDVPDPLEDWSALNPQSSYGSQKAAGEFFVTDYSRKGFIDGRGLRLPTVTVRPGKPNKASTSFMSSIFREPLQGQSANCPVSTDFPVWHCSARTVVDNFIHAAKIDAQDLGLNRCFALPGRCDTIGEMIAAMTAVAGPEPATRITWERDAHIEGLVNGFRSRIVPTKALALGFTPDASFEDNIRYFLEDDIETPA